MAADTVVIVNLSFCRSKVLRKRRDNCSCLRKTGARLPFYVLAKGASEARMASRDGQGKIRTSRVNLRKADDILWRPMR